MAYCNLYNLQCTVQCTITHAAKGITCSLKVRMYSQGFHSKALVQHILNSCTLMDPDQESFEAQRTKGPQVAHGAPGSSEDQLKLNGPHVAQRII